MKALTEQDFQEAAKKLNCEAAVIKAVAKVESAGGGFLDNGAPKILFEGHQFYKRTPVEVKNKSIAAKGWTEARKYYQDGVEEYTRLTLAMSYDANAALQSASWGKFQIMGFNYHNCLYSDVFEMVQDMFKSEKEHLKAFLNFIDSTGLTRAMIDKDWNKFSRGYNGSRYKENKYDEKLESAYLKFLIG